jgi:hypothetical protein
MNRRDFFRRTGERAFVIGATTVGLSGIANGDGVPPQMDCRTDVGAGMVPIRIYRNGREVQHVVAYDLNAQTVTRYRIGPDGRIVLSGGDGDYITEYGGVVVRWTDA